MWTLIRTPYCTNIELVGEKLFSEYLLKNRENQPSQLLLAFQESTELRSFDPYLFQFDLLTSNDLVSVGHGQPESGLVHGQGKLFPKI